MNTEERVKVIKAMDTLARCINDECIFNSWLISGVADGDGESTDANIADNYTEDETFRDLLSLFLKLMYRASRDGLYCDKVLSKTKHIEWK